MNNRCAKNLVSKSKKKQRRYPNNSNKVQKLCNPYPCFLLGNFFTSITCVTALCPGDQSENLVIVIDALEEEGTSYRGDDDGVDEDTEEGEVAPAKHGCQD